ncbi:MAG: DUF86 domain-containing protein [Proteobacteria bacterium]|nr:DUF86 domain-containing protein [Pseudomonadota bacterium]
MQPDTKKHLHDILTAIEDIELFVQDAVFEDLLSNRMLQAAVEREFEIVGEALNRILKITFVLLPFGGIYLQFYTFIPIFLSSLKLHHF